MAEFHSMSSLCEVHCQINCVLKPMFICMDGPHESSSHYIILGWGTYKCRWTRQVRLFHQYIWLIQLTGLVLVFVHYVWWVVSAHDGKGDCMKRLFALAGNRGRKATVLWVSYLTYGRKGRCWGESLSIFAPNNKNEGERERVFVMWKTGWPGILLGGHYEENNHWEGDKWKKGFLWNN